MAKRHLKFIITLYNLQVLCIEYMYVYNQIILQLSLFCKTKVYNILPPSPSLPSHLLKWLFYFLPLYFKKLFLYCLFFLISNFCNLFSALTLLYSPTCISKIILSSFPFLTQYENVKVLVIQSCPTLCNPMNCSPPDSSVHGILQAGILELVAISFSKWSSRPRDGTRVSHTAGGFFTIWDTREILSFTLILMK